MADLVITLFFFVFNNHLNLFMLLPANPYCKSLPVILAIVILSSCSQKFAAGSSSNSKKNNSGTTTFKTLYMNSDFSGIYFSSEKSNSQSPQLFTSPIVKANGQGNPGLSSSNERKVFYPTSPGLVNYFLDRVNDEKQPATVNMDAILTDMNGNYMTVKYEGHLLDLMQQNGWASFKLSGTITGGMVGIYSPEGEITTAIEINRTSGESKITHAGTVYLH
jgi:hypothetical protein